ncbi:hypothetical protein PENSPDRAFT_503622 [Peniophora sp. CONT]|nr:hypothetical protein PENSPDRAFT_503622 [Peniophora sp. CONT]
MAFLNIAVRCCATDESADLAPRPACEYIGRCHGSAGIPSLFVPSRIRARRGKFLGGLPGRRVLTLAEESMWASGSGLWSRFGALKSVEMRGIRASPASSGCKLTRPLPSATMRGTRVTVARIVVEMRSSSVSAHIAHASHRRRRHDFPLALELTWGGSLNVLGSLHVHPSRVSAQFMAAGGYVLSGRRVLTLTEECVHLEVVDCGPVSSP